MICNAKALGLALVAAFAIGALIASPASATDLFTVSGGGSAILTGTSHDNVFSIPGASSFECTTSKFASTITNGATSAKVDVTYEGLLNATPHGVPCTATLGNVTIHVNGCETNLAGETTGKDGVTTDAIVSIQCPAGKEIEITGPLGCTIRIPSQTPTEGGVTYDNLLNHSGASAIRVTATLTGITFTVTEPCTIAGIPEHGNNMTYKGTATLTGFKDTEGLPTPVTEGAQKAISVS